QGKLDMVTQEMARVNINILIINELKRTGMGEFNSDDHYIYYCGQESLRRNGLPIYTAPPLQSKYVEEQPGHLQMGFASIRTTTGRYIGWCKGVYVFVKNGIMDTVQFGKDAYVYLKNPPRDFLPKIGVITVSGLAGFISARKGKVKIYIFPLSMKTSYPLLILKKPVLKSYTMYDSIHIILKKRESPQPLPGLMVSSEDLGDSTYTCYYNPCTYHNRSNTVPIDNINGSLYHSFYSNTICNL
ncbi:hypothetical protein FD755_024559, partial [Muntiacus reevesi]